MATPMNVVHDFPGAVSMSFLRYAVLSAVVALLLRRVFGWNSVTLKNQKRKPATAPSLIPFISHTIAIASGGEKLFSTFKQYCGLTSPIRFRMLGQDLILLSASDIRKTVHNPHVFTDNKLRARFISNVFGIPQAAADVVGVDNSGSAIRPTPGSNVAPDRRIVRMQQETAFDFLQSKDGISTFLDKFVGFLEQEIATKKIGEEWKEFDDFFDFVRKTSSTAVMNAVCGPRLMQRCPKFVDAFWTFDENVHLLHIQLPKFFIPKAYEARQVCLDALKEWKRNAIETTKGNTYTKEDRWDETWGLQVMRTRNGLYDRFKEYHSDAARAGSDLGIVWASNDNLIPAAFWLVQALVKSPELRDRCLVEINEARLPAVDGDGLPRFDTEILIKQPLLQSAYHEVLRTQVTSFIARDVEQDFVLGDHLLPKGSYALTVPWVENHNKERWESRPGATGHPVEEFWPERFLVPKKDGEGAEFSLKGLEGSFFPFGMGHHICPGRHFATRAILNLVATLVTAFEFEPVEKESWKDPGQNPQTFGYTPFRPTKKLPFRVRKAV
ncbi:cytochrome P450 [Aaosphaeria arxii CBS 175.79]|uniref:Cytochrome P450 n=1 Tax=Aaosphaeria arxii CBS 175.79 TaxID=1450172 RepID=A0A6A5XM70_9PLEO|nr:cytochrome P450 [Aaosphaeria arxii CBS 175.79]KAF2014338.1 cytochrome P450 [Aaosphaeria arxii CBS 175.79]